MNKYITIFFILLINFSCTENKKHSENHTCSPESMKRFSSETLDDQNENLKREIISHAKTNDFLDKDESEIRSKHKNLINDILSCLK